MCFTQKVLKVYTYEAQQNLKYLISHLHSTPKLPQKFYIYTIANLVHFYKEFNPFIYF